MKFDDQGTFAVDVTVKRATAKAVQVNDGTRNVWIPKSLIGNLRDLPPNGRTFSIELPEWFLEKEALV